MATVVLVLKWHCVYQKLSAARRKVGSRCSTPMTFGKQESLSIFRMLRLSNLPRNFIIEVQQQPIFGVAPNKRINLCVTAGSFGPAMHFRSKRARCNTQVIQALGVIGIDHCSSKSSERSVKSKPSPLAAVFARLCGCGSNSVPVGGGNARESLRFALRTVPFGVQNYIGTKLTASAIVR